MKNINGLFINKIIHNFKKIATGIKPCEQEFIVITLKKTVKQRTSKSHANIIFDNTVLERRLIEKVINEHLEVNIA